MTIDKKNEYVKEHVWKDYETGESITGVLTDIMEDMGEYSNRLYKIKGDDDEFIAVWGSVDLDEKIDKQEIGIGMKIRVTYNGLIHTSNGFDMKDFTVEILD